MSSSFVLCFAVQRLVFGAVIEEGGGALTVLASEGELAIREHQVLLRWADPSAAPTGGRDALPAILAEKLAWLQAAAARLPLSDLPGKLPSGKALTLESIAAALIADPQQASDGWQRAALCLALVEDRQHFRRERGGFVAVDPQEQRARAAREAQMREERELAKVAVGWAAELERGRWPGADHPAAPAFLAAVYSLAAHEKHAPVWATLGRTLGLHEHGAVSVTHRLQPWLATARAWPGWPAFWLERAQVRLAFPPEVLEAAARLAQHEPAAQDRQDLRTRESYTIDAANTFDYDDAYSVERENGALIVAVHIAEPTGDLLPGHCVFEEAALRGSSVYSEQGVYPMLPPALSLGRFSMLRGRAREAVTFRFRVTESGLEWISLDRTLIEVRANLDYAAAEGLIAGQPETWGSLHAACEAQAQDRARRGAQLSERKDVRLDVADPERVKLAIVSRGGPANRVVEELAIAYNLAAGLYCHRNQVPALYRVQSRAPGRAGALHMAHARFSTQGGPHDGLACERYAQTTSPNRRFGDLLMQRQIAGHAAGRGAPFTSEQLAAWGDHLEARAAAYDEAERAIQEHWVRVFLRQHPQWEVWGTVRKVDTGTARVWLDELALPAQAEASGRLTPGKRQRFRVSASDPDVQRVWVTPV